MNEKGECPIVLRYILNLKITIQLSVHLTVTLTILMINKLCKKKPL